MVGGDATARLVSVRPTLPTKAFWAAIASSMT
jgi:hypothetical protein